MLNNQTPSLGWNDGAKLLLLADCAKNNCGNLQVCKLLIISYL